MHGKLFVGLLFLEGLQMKKRMTGLYLVIVMLMTFGCSSGQKKDVENMSMKKAYDISNQYLQYIYEGNIEGAKTLLSNKLNSKTKEELSTIKITSYQVKDVVESATSITTKYIITTGERESSKCGVDSYSFKIEKEGKEYKIFETKVVPLKFVYGEGNTLRVRRTNDGTSDMLIRLKDLPNEMYVKGEGASINKINLPNKAFGVIGIGVTGRKIAISTNDSADTYLAIVIDEEAKESFAIVGGNEASGDANKKSIDEVIEKPIAQQLNSIDVLKNTVIERLQFDNNEDKLIATVRESGKGRTLKIYNSTSGEEIPLELDKQFSDEKYNVDIISLEDEFIEIYVSSISGTADDVVGLYRVDCKKLETIKK